MPETQAYNATFLLLTYSKVQLEKWILLMYPDPSFGGGGGTAWSWEIFDTNTTTIIQTGSELYGPVTFNNYREVQIADPTYVAGHRYRVRIFDSTLALVDEWYFIVYTNNFAGLPPFNTAQVNDRIKRIAGLLGYNQVVTNEEHDKGIPAKSTINLYNGDPNDPGSVVFATYEQRKFHDPQFRVNGEISTKVL